MTNRAPSRCLVVLSAFLVATSSATGGVLPAAAAPTEDCGETMTRLKAAYIEDPRPSYLLAIANCARLLGDDLDAIRVYRSYLARVPDSASRSQVEAAIKELEDKLAVAAATPSPPNPMPVAMTPGRLVTVARAPEPASGNSHRRLWIWTTIGIVVAGTMGGLVLWARRDPPCPRGFDCR